MGFLVDLEVSLTPVAPLCDSRGKIRYFIGAQVDVSGLVKDSTDLESLDRLVRCARRKQHNISDGANDDDATVNEIAEPPRKDEFQELSEMLNVSELETVRSHGGRMHSELTDTDDRASARASNRPRLLIKEPSGEMQEEQQAPLLSSRGRLPGVYQHVCTLDINLLLLVLIVQSTSCFGPTHLFAFSLLPLLYGFQAYYNHRFFHESADPVGSETSSLVRLRKVET